MSKNPFEGLLGLTSWDWIWIILGLILVGSILLLSSKRR